MRDPVLLKVPGVNMIRVEQLMNFINSEDNRPVGDVTNVTSGSYLRRQHVKLLDMEIDSPKHNSDDPVYKLSLLVQTEYGVCNNCGGTEAQTPRSVIEEVFDRLGIFPKGPAS